MKSFIHATALVIGTAIGAGFLALPLSGAHLSVPLIILATLVSVFVTYRSSVMAVDLNEFYQSPASLDKLCRMKPSYLTEMYRVELMKQWLQYNEQKSMESLFESVAAERDIPVIGLDNIGETMYMLFDREPFHWQCKELLKVIQYPENEVRQERTLRDMYLNGRLSDIAYQIEGPDNTTSISFSDYKVYCQRNKEWVKRLKPHLTQGGCFITLNAIYLGGDKGLIEQLRAAGFRVRPVNRNNLFKQQ